MTQQAQIGGRVGIKVTFECLDAAGQVVKVIHGEGSVPLESLTEEQRAALVEQQNGTNNRG